MLVYLLWLSPAAGAILCAIRKCALCRLGFPAAHSAETSTPFAPTGKFHAAPALPSPGILSLPIIAWISFSGPDREASLERSASISTVSAGNCMRGGGPSIVSSMFKGQ